MSRAWLLALAGAAGAAAGDGYVGSRACAGCHKPIYDSYQRTSMGRSTTPVGADLPLARVPSEKFNRVFEVTRERDGIYQSESEPGVFVSKHKLEYAIGSGVNGVTYAVRRGNHLFQAPLSYYSRAGRWDLSPGYEFADYGFSRPIHSGCIICHSGRPQALEDRNGLYLNPPFREMAVGCENCHGPGEAHILAKGARARIVNPARLEPRLADDICMRCHQGGDARVLQPGKSYADFRPGQWLNETLAIFKAPSQGDADLLEHHSAMESSRCFTGSAGKLRCISCHDPHRTQRGSEAAAWYRARCLGCHTQASCRLPAAAREARANDCAGCHMPKREVGFISHSALTNHRIPSRPNQPPPATTGGADLIHVNRPPAAKAPAPITLLRAYGEVMGKRPEFQERYLALLEQLAVSAPKDPLVQAALGRKAMREAGAEAIERAMGHLSRAIELGFAGYTAREDLAEIYSRAGRLEEAARTLQHAIELDPYVPTLYKSLALRYIHLKQYALARQTIERYVELFPEDNFMRNLLKQVNREPLPPPGFRPAPRE